MNTGNITPETLTSNDSGIGDQVMKGASHAHAIIMAIGGLIVVVNTTCALLDRIKASRKTPEQKNAEKRASGRAWAEEFRKVFAEDQLEAAVEKRAEELLEEAMKPVIERLEAIEGAAKKTAKKK